MASATAPATFAPASPATAAACCPPLAMEGPLIDLSSEGVFRPEDWIGRQKKWDDAGFVMLPHAAINSQLERSRCCANAHQCPGPKKPVRVRRTALPDAGYPNGYCLDTLLGSGRLWPFRDTAAGACVKSFELLWDGAHYHSKRHLAGYALRLTSTSAGRIIKHGRRGSVSRAERDMPPRVMAEGRVGYFYIPVNIAALGYVYIPAIIAALSECAPHWHWHSAEPRARFSPPCCTIFMSAMALSRHSTRFDNVGTERCRAMARTGRCTAALDAKKSQIQTTMYRSFFVIFEPKIAEVVGDDEQSDMHTLNVDHDDELSHASDVDGRHCSAYLKGWYCRLIHHAASLARDPDAWWRISPERCSGKPVRGTPRRVLARAAMRRHNADSLRLVQFIKAPTREALTIAPAASASAQRGGQNCALSVGRQQAAYGVRQARGTRVPRRTSSGEQTTWCGQLVLHDQCAVWMRPVVLLGTGSSEWRFFKMRACSGQRVASGASWGTLIPTLAGVLRFGGINDYQGVSDKIRGLNKKPFG
ncbi:hypothetical protein GGX14DRAFT_408516 [Mycena pura]|uniref:Uncharacterized protein n=1 Tax=Mycena pura TaxID=153505 RepID=A0AAD6UMP8_9AGAR|nr:hypothetical protein GGX14DRAFT_408516 [Mycena pura]